MTKSLGAGHNPALMGIKSFLEGLFGGVPEAKAAVKPTLPAKRISTGALPNFAPNSSSVRGQPALPPRPQHTSSFFYRSIAESVASALHVVLVDEGIRYRKGLGDSLDQNFQLDDGKSFVHLHPVSVEGIEALTGNILKNTDIFLLIVLQKQALARVVPELVRHGVAPKVQDIYLGGIENQMTDDLRTKLEGAGYAGDVHVAPSMTPEELVASVSLLIEKKIAAIGGFQRTVVPVSVGLDGVAKR